jgi:phosphatidate cytidylyltransferase
MNITISRNFLYLFGGVVALLTVSSIVGAVLHARVKSDSARAVVANLNARIRAWWVMSAVFAGATVIGRLGSIILFGLTSFLALREFITLSPTRKGDHRTLFWTFFAILPLQYYFVATKWYGMFAIFIPVYAFLFVPVRSVLAGDTDDFLARTSKIQWGLMLSVFCVSHAPALLMLDIPHYASRNAELLFFLVLVVQMSDVLQYVFGKLLGKHKIVPTVSPNKTWEGFIGGIATTSLLGASLWWITPFTPLRAGLITLLVTLAGFGGGLCMSAIKRDRGIKDFGTLIEGHGGTMDRIDSLCFAAPLFFHVTRYLYT